MEGRLQEEEEEEEEEEEKEEEEALWQMLGALSRLPQNSGRLTFRLAMDVDAVDDPGQKATPGILFRSGHKEALGVIGEGQVVLTWRADLPLSGE